MNLSPEHEERPHPSASKPLFSRKTHPALPHLALGEFGRAVGAEVAHALKSAAGVAEEHKRLVEDRHRDGLGALHDVPVIPYGIPADVAKQRERQREGKGERGKQRAG